ncbi:MAG: ABC-F family ATP-binding cassette domain-containing protein [Acidimicrobiales bacterium]|nr:ABC-F family ATP-binding cassette domain-containing protein [Acidimicrobiales bacterium]
MITVSGLAKAHGTKQLFRDVTFRLLPGRRIALVGGNGKGKTTLLEIVLGMQEPDAGEIHRGKGTRVGYLPQEAVGTADPHETVLASVLAGAGPVHELELQLQSLHEQLGSATGAEHDRAMRDYGEAQSRFEQLGGYALEAEAQRILAGLGFSEQAARRPLRELSGGWQMRAALARLMLDKPDVLVLDEPTNHLDTDSVAWLEATLAAYSGAILFVSHDRDFIDAVAERVIELAEGTAIEYVGGFAEFVVQREDRQQQLRAAAASQQRQIAHVERFVERFRYKATKSRQVQSRLKTLERLDRIELPNTKELIAKFAFPEPQRSARVVAELTGVSIGYDAEAVLTGVDLVIERGEKLALVGPNGAGKTTLIRLLLGQLQPLEGTYVRGANVDVAYFAQEQAQILDDQLTVAMEFQKAVGDQPRGRNVRTVLGSFGFPGDAADRRVGDLSGGERTRLALAKIMVNPVNLLVLDEPTNHLDLQSCDVLEDALRAYPGTVILVSHDRYLIREVAQSLVAVRDGRAVRFDGVDEAILSPSAEVAASSFGRGAPVGAQKAPGRSNTRPPGPAGAKGPNARTAKTAKTAKTATAAAPTVAVAAKASARPGEAKRSEAELRQARHRATKELRTKVEKVERQLAKAEAEVAELQRQLADPVVYADSEQVKSLVERHNTAKDRASALMDEWTEAQLALEETAARFS